MIMVIEMDFTDDEMKALARYQNIDYRVINSLLRHGYESEKTINERAGRDYPYLTRDMLNEYLFCIDQIYSVILKAYRYNNYLPPDKVTYRGTQKAILEAMNNDECSFLSTSTSHIQTRNFSVLYSKDGIKNDSERAIAIVEGNIPWIDLDEFMGGMEGEIIYVPAKVSVTPIDTNLDPKLGKTYKMTLSELEIPEKTEEEIKGMRKTILDKTETMSDYLKLILEAQTNLSLQNTPQLAFATKEYCNWKDLVVSYNHQQYRLLKNNIIEQNKVEEIKKY